MAVAVWLRVLVIHRYLVVGGAAAVPRRVGMRHALTSTAIQRWTMGAVGRSHAHVTQMSIVQATGTVRRGIGVTQLVMLRQKSVILVNAYPYSQRWFSVWSLVY
jgi:hypothetical protein